jgi:4a-hydroxytetrahydrobiopterin dehydratase
MATLTAEQVQTELATMPDWSVRTEAGESAITRTVTRKDFRDALLYLNAVGYLAEAANHHPDVAVSWNKVTLTLVTHSEGGLTGKDIALARQIDLL